MHSILCISMHYLYKVMQFYAEHPKFILISSKFILISILFYANFMQPVMQFKFLILEKFVHYMHSAFC
jgi:hypothetical protein